MKLSTVLLLFALSFVCAAANKRFDKFKKNGACSPPTVEKLYTNCMKKAGQTSATSATAKCRTDLEEKLETCHGKTPDDFTVDGVIKKAIQHANEECKSNCDELDKHLRASDKGRTDQEKRREEIEKKAGAGKKTADKVTSCMEVCKPSCTEIQKQNCTGDVAKKALKDVLGREPEDWEVKENVDKGARTEAGNLMKECYTLATNDQERKACGSDTEILNACKQARGGEACSTDDLKKGARDVAKKDIDEMMNACVSGKASKESKKKCRTDNMEDLKEKVANAMGKDKSKVKDSDVQKVLDEAARDAFAEAMKACGASADRKECQSDAKKAMADARGEDEADIKEVDIKRESRKAQAKNLATEMEACMDLAEKKSGDTAKTTARGKCSTESAKEALKRGSLDGKAPTDKEVKEFQNMAAKEAMRDARENCEGDCDKKVKAAMAKALGKKSEDITTFDHRKFEEEAAIASVADEFRACAKAKKDKSTAECKDPLAAFAESSGREEPTDNKKKETFKKELAKKVVQDAEKESVRACMKESTKTKVQDCLKEAKSDVDNVASVAFEGETADKIQKKKKQAEKKASESALGDEFRDCMEAASTDNAKKTACKTDVESKKELLGVNTPIKHVLKSYRADLLLSPSDSCNSTEIKSCRQNAKAEAIKNGMEARAYAQTKKIAEVKGAAEKFASCRDGGNVESDCSDQAKETYLSISGAKADSYKDKVKTRIEDLGKKIFKGDVTKLVDKEAVTVTVETNGGACNDGVKTAFKDEVKKHVGDGASSTADTKKLQQVAKDVDCRVVDDKAEYAVSVDAKGVSTDDIGTASGDLSTKLSSKAYITSRRVRRLLNTQTTTGAYADQETTMCSESDTECTGESAEVEVSSSAKGVSVTFASIASILVAFIFA